MTLPTGIPAWVAVLVLILTSSGGAAIFQYLQTRATNRANRDITGSEARLKDVTALGDALDSLSRENARLVKRVSELEGKNESLEKRVDELEDELIEQRRRRYQVEEHLVEAEARINTLETEIVSLGGNPEA